MVGERRYMDYRQWCMLVSTVSGGSFAVEAILRAFAGAAAMQLEPGLSMLSIVLGGSFGYYCYRLAVRQ
jgi:hypothetical protein